MNGYEPTYNFRWAVWNVAGSAQFTRLQQEWVSDVPGEEPQWRNVAHWSMPPRSPLDAPGYHRSGDPL